MKKITNEWVTKHFYPTKFTKRRFSKFTNYEWLMFPTSTPADQNYEKLFSKIWRILPSRAWHRFIYVCKQQSALIHLLLHTIHIPIVKSEKESPSRFFLSRRSFFIWQDILLGIVFAIAFKGLTRLSAALRVRFSRLKWFKYININNTISAEIFFTHRDKIIDAHCLKIQYRSVEF